MIISYASFCVSVEWSPIFSLSLLTDQGKFQSEGHRQILTKELEAVGLRLNKRPPQVMHSFIGHCLYVYLYFLAFFFLNLVCLVSPRYKYKLAYWEILL